MRRWIVVGLIALVLLAACGGGPGGRVLLEERCDRCHSLTLITESEKTAEEWGMTVDRMMMRGAQLTEAERDILVDYLAREY